MKSYKMKYVCEQTGLTEKAVRFYIEKKLIKPQIIPGVHSNSYEFTEENIEELKQIAVLRSADFSIAEIAQLKENPEDLPSALEEKKSILEMDLNKKKILLELYDRMEGTDKGTLENVAEALSPITRFENPGKPSWGKRLAAIGILAAVILIIYASLLMGKELPARLLADVFVFLLLGVLFLGGGLYYLFIPRRARKMKHHAQAKVIAIAQETGFDSGFAMGKSIVPGSGFFEQGLGGSWQYLAMFWNEIRPDNWFPILQYTGEDGKLHSATMKTGGSRHNWKEGEMIPVAWEKEDGLVYPEGTWLQKKAFVYILIGIAAMVLAIVSGTPVMKALMSENAQFYHTIGEVYHGINEQIDGQEIVSADQIELNYAVFAGEKDYPLSVETGDRITVKVMRNPNQKADFLFDLIQPDGISLTGGYDMNDGTYYYYTFTATETGEYQIRLRGNDTDGGYILIKKEPVTD